MVVRLPESDRSRPGERAASNVTDQGDSLILLREPCPPEHSERLAAAGIALPLDHGDSWSMRPADHGCPLCFTKYRGFCVTCELANVALMKFEGPVEDPYCPWHPRITGATRRACGTCAASHARAKRAGWSRPTGHIGEDCAHCWVCGACPGAVRVCRDCRRCPEHLLDAETTPECPACLRWHWDRFARAERPYFAHRYYGTSASRWSA